MVIADLEIHSRFARACSKTLSIPELNEWAKRKGVSLLSTGDITHPLWRREVRSQLRAKENGFYIFNEETSDAAPRFVLGGEVSLMFRQGEIKGRRVHLLFLAPTFEAVERLVERINHKGKLASDGRVILSMSCQEFAEACHLADPNIMIIPAHIWTPWFGLLGSKSGFDSIEEAFGEWAQKITAYESGLSADPKMCWRVESLRSRVLISSSDAHSSPNMMREATLLHGSIQDYSYEKLQSLLSKPGHKDYWGTLEFYPEEGKYHFDGHAACKQSLEPKETKRLNGLCPVCGKPVTVGVLHRVDDLASVAVGDKPEGAGEVFYAVPLQEVIAAVLGKNKTAKAVQSLYFQMTDELGTEFDILKHRTSVPSWVPDRIMPAIEAMRRGTVKLKSGYDGIYGNVLFDEFTSNQI